MELVQMKNMFKIKIVLTKTLYDRNIGSTSRVMDNMGVSELILVSPKCEITYEAQLAAATGQSALQNRTVYSSWIEFYQNEAEGVRIAFTARDGRGRLVKDFDFQLKQFLKNHEQKLSSTDEGEAQSATLGNTLYLIFGPEDAGLTAEDLENTNFSVSLPTFGDNTSYNLSHAVLVALQILRQNIGGQRSILEGSQKPILIEAPKIELIGDTIREWLALMGLDLESHHKINAYTVIHRMLLQNTPTQKEYHMLETMLQQTIRKLKRLNELEKQNK